MSAGIYTWHDMGSGIAVPNDLLGARTLMSRWPPVKDTYDKVAGHILHHMCQVGFLELPTDLNSVTPMMHFDQTVRAATGWLYSVFHQFISHLDQTKVTERMSKA